MINDLSYRKAFFTAIGLHLLLVLLLLTDSTTQRPVLTRETKNTPGLEQPVALASQQEVVKAVSIDNKEITEAVNRLKQEREQKQQAETQRQNELQSQARAARQERIKEQQHVAQLKEEANKIAILRKKQVEEEKKRLQELTRKKAEEAQRIEALKKQKEQLLKQQELEEKKLTELNKKKVAEQAKAADKLKKEKAQEQKHRAEMASAQARADMESKRQAQAAAAQHASQDADRQARIAGEVDKYKALIVNAIGRNWILPEHADSSLSSQFRIHLASDGTVLDVSLIRSSGDPLLDRSAQTAIFKASPLPVPANAETFNLFRDISLTVRPEQVRG